MKLLDLKKSKLPDNPGIYKFLDNKGRILYIGKATNLRDRVKSYFSSDLINMRGMFLVDMVTKAKKVDFIKTDSVLEALILETNLIKKHQPKYNTKEKDNKSFNYVCITKEAIPKVLIVRGRAIDFKKLKAGSQQLKAIFGPFTNSNQLYEAMKIIRRIFPYFDNQSSKKQNKKFYDQLSLNPRLLEEGAGGGDYKKNISNLILFFQGKKKKILQNLKKEMMVHAKRREFERAGEIKKQIFALNHINDVALIKEENLASQMQKNFAALPSLRGLRHGQNFSAFTSLRIEAYDIAHMSGKNMVGVMTVVEACPNAEGGRGEVKKSAYKKFIIKTIKGANDAGALREVIVRRLNHLEWKLPDMIVADGNQIQKNVIEKELKNRKLQIPVVAVVKDAKHKARAIIGDASLIKQYKKAILLANSEAHRFAIAFHKNKRNKAFLANF